MKKLLGQDASGTYTFNPSAKTITFSGLSQQITLANILLITNVTANTIIYNFADSSNGATSFANNVLTLDHNTTSMNSTDVLQIYLDLAGEESLHDLLRRMNKLLESNAVVDSSLRQRVTLDAIGSTPTALTTTVPVSGTVTATASGTYSVSNGVATQLVSNSATNPYTLTSSTTGLIMEGPVHQLWRIANDAQTCYASAIRSKLTFS
jgi:hypothetical protein